MAKRPMTELDVEEARALVRDGRANHSVNGCFVNGHGTDHRCWWCRRVDDKPWSQVAQAVLAMEVQRRLGDPSHDGSAWATLDGRSLYRLAKAIVREFEREGT
jgi:hypothetical protein